MVVILNKEKLSSFENDKLRSLALAESERTGISMNQDEYTEMVLKKQIYKDASKNKPTNDGST